MTRVHRYHHSFVFIAVTTAAASSVSLLGGLGLEYVSDKILPLVPLIVAIPALNDLVGDYATIIAAHTGDPAERASTHGQLARAIFRVVGVNIVAIIGLSLLVAHSRGYIFSTGFLLRFAGFITGSIVLVVIFMFAIAKLLDRLLLKRGINPDELLIPIITSVADIAMLGLVTLAVLTIF
jgi:cation transporter-like permease